MKKMFGLINLVALLSLPSALYGWENKLTHPAITAQAVSSSSAKIDDYLKTQLNLSSGLSTQLYWDFPQDIKTRIARGNANPDQTTRSILEWIKVGSIIEDTEETPGPLRAVAPWRPRHHFLDPTRNSGLDNHADYPTWEAPDGWIPLGESALDWAINGHSSYEPYDNYDKWASARNVFYQSMIEPNKAIRQADLAQSLLKLGCVLHLLEDQGVPAHTRNDFLFAHYRHWYNSGEALEKDTEAKVEGNGGNSLWSGSSTVVFDKLTKYFDTDTRDPEHYLGDGISPPEELWGLSECTNYQFLSLSTIFREDVIIDPNTGERTRYYFPHPAKGHIATPAVVEYIIDGNDIRRKIYFNGSNYCVPHLARYSYTYYKKSIWGGDVPVVDSTNTTDDVNVFIDYADITIPRTIDYATGLANYFFRGRLSVEPNWADPNIVELVITNDSNNSGILQTLKGGTFEIYWDDVNDTRTQIGPNNITFTPAWTPASTLPNDGGVTKLIAQFAPPAEQPKKYIVVYKGNICENPADLDLNDPNAIAVAILPCGYEIVAWAIDPINKGDKYGQVSNVPDGSDFVDVAAGKKHCLAIRSDGSLVGWGCDTHGECNVPAGNDYIAIAAGLYHSIALKSDGSIVVWGWDNLNQITDKPTGNNFVAIAAGEWHSLALKSDGTIVGWGGWNDYGECDAPAPDPGTVFTAISAGKYHSLALQSDGVVKAWGSNGQGQTRIYDSAAGKVHVAVAACDYYSFLLRDDLMLISWGGDDWLSPGIPRYHYRYPDGTDFIAIAAGWDHILSLTSDGEILSWYWPFGDFSFDYFSRTVPEGIVFTDDISAGYDFSLSLKAP